MHFSQTLIKTTSQKDVSDCSVSFHLCRMPRVWRWNPGKAALPLPLSQHLHYRVLSYPLQAMCLPPFSSSWVQPWILHGHRATALCNSPHSVSPGHPRTTVLLHTRGVLGLSFRMHTVPHSQDNFTGLCTQQQLLISAAQIIRFGLTPPSDTQLSKLILSKLRFLKEVTRIWKVCEILQYL